MAVTLQHLLHIFNPLFASRRALEIQSPRKEKHETSNRTSSHSHNNKSLKRNLLHGLDSIHFRSRQRRGNYVITFIGYQIVRGGLPEDKTTPSPPDGPDHDHSHIAIVYPKQLFRLCYTRGRTIASWATAPKEK